MINFFTLSLGVGVGTVIAIASYIAGQILAEHAPQYAKKLKENITVPYIVSFITLVLVYAIVKSIVPALIAAGIILYVPRQLDYAQQRRRKILILEQLSAAVSLFANTFLITKSIPRGLETIARRIPDPVGEIFQTAYTELTFGVSLNVVADKLARNLGVSYGYIFANLLKSADKQGDMVAPLFRDLGYKIVAAQEKANFQRTEVSTVRYTNIFLLSLPAPAYLILLNNMPEATAKFIQTTAGHAVFTFWLVAIIAWIFIDRLIVDG